MRLKWLALAVAAAALPAAARAQALRWSEPEAFRQAMIADGYEADLYSSDQGSARINAHRRGAQGSFNLDFLPCGDDMDGDCRMISFSLPAVLDSVPSLRAAWNRSRGRPADSAVALGQDGYDDPVSIAMEMEVEIPAAGLPQTQFLARLRSWQALVETFERLLARP